MRRLIDWMQDRSGSDDVGNVEYVALTVVAIVLLVIGFVLLEFKKAKVLGSMLLMGATLQDVREVIHGSERYADEQQEIRRIRRR